MKAVKVLTAMVVASFALVSIASAEDLYDHKVWIKYLYGENPARGDWSVVNNRTMLGPWNATAYDYPQGETPPPTGNLYCIEPHVIEGGSPYGHWHFFEPISIASYTPENPEISNAGVRWAANLIYNVDPYMNSSDRLTRASLQLAIWEALFDEHNRARTDDWWDSCFTEGDFRVDNLIVPGGSGFTASQVREEASGYLKSYQGSYIHGTVYHDGQDLLRVDVPEPGSLLLLGFGLAGAGVVAWRRRR